MVKHHTREHVDYTCLREMLQIGGGYPNPDWVLEVCGPNCDLSLGDAQNYYPPKSGKHPPTRYQCTLP